MDGSNRIKFKQISNLKQIILLVFICVIVLCTMFEQYCLYCTLLNLNVSSHLGTESAMNLTFLLICYFPFFLHVFILLVLHLPCTVF